MTLASTLLLASLPILINLYAERYREDDLEKAFPDDPEDLTLPRDETFDFIVVGAGAAGCVISRRLADAGFTVLLLEQGGNPPPILTTPFYLELNRGVKSIAYLYKSRVQKNSGLADKGILMTTAGKVMGGGTSLGGRGYERGSPYDYSNWSNITGDLSWQYENIMQYFLKSEKYMGEFPLNGQHSTSGMMIVTHPDYHPGSHVWLSAGESLGFRVKDPNGPQSIGFSPEELNTFRGRRVSTYTAYIQPVEESLNTLTVRRYSSVNQILIQDGKAWGVSYKRHGVPRIARANKEVIVSAGAYRSPLLLIASGIGPADQLKAAKVQPIKILPGVGKNFMNHAGVSVHFSVERPEFAWKLSENLTFDDFTTYIDRGSGPLSTQDDGDIAEAYIASSRAASQDNNAQWPDIQLLYSYIDEDQTMSVRCNAVIGRPKSRGSITFNSSASGFEDDNLAIIDFNFFDQESDLDVVVEGIRMCQQLVKTPPFQKIGARLDNRRIRQCRKFQQNSKAYWKCYIRTTSGVGGAYHHPAGSCRMGQQGDRMAVVDSKLKVMGLEKLRVVDSSIMPVVTNSFISAPTVMIAEKASAEIIAQYKV